LDIHYTKKQSQNLGATNAIDGLLLTIQLLKHVLSRAWPS